MLAMTGHTNPRKVYETGGSTVLSLPKAFREENGIELGDTFVFEPTEDGFRAIEVELTRKND